jgi:hypothetical protein
MVLFFCFCWLLTLYVAGYATAKNKDIFGPARLITTIFILRHLPFILYIAINPHAFNRKILSVCNVSLSDAFIKYTFTETIAYISLLAGIHFFTRKENPDAATNFTLNYKRLKIAAVLLFIIGFGAYAFFIMRLGGLSYLLSNIEERVLLIQGHYYLALKLMLNVLPLVFMYCYKVSQSKIYVLLLVLSIFICIGVNATLGGREPALLFLLGILLGYHFILGPIRLSKTFLLGASGIVVLLCAYIFAVPILRHDNMRSYNQGGLASYVTPKTFVYQTSHVYIDIFACNYFNRDNARYLHGFFEPIAAFNAKGDKGDIPQVDQGVYFKSIVVRQRYYAPPIPRKELVPLAWPTENFGFAYSNFLLPGILFFFFLQGMVFSLTYRWFKRYPYNVALIVLYVFVIFTFNFSSATLAAFVRTFSLLFICYLFFNRFVAVKKQR